MIDAHCHVARWPEAEKGCFDFLQLKKSGITDFVQGGIDASDARLQLQIRSRFEQEGLRFWPVFGVHPWRVAELGNDWKLEWDKIVEWMSQAVAVGETGLDYQKRFSLQQRKIQREAFEFQLNWAIEHSKPVVLHVVRAHGDALEVLENLGRRCSGLVHSFSASSDQMVSIAQRYADYGFLISLGASWARPEKLGELAVLWNSFPSSFFALESDSPDQAADSTVILSLAAAIASVSKNVHFQSAKQVLQQCRQNCVELFCLR